MKTIRFILLCFLIAFPYEAISSDKTIVKYPIGSTDYSLRTRIGLAAVEMALQATEKDYGPWEVVLYETLTERKRREATLERGVEANTLMLPGKTEYDDRFILVPVPLDRGLLGYRIAFVNSDQPDLLKDVRNIEDLRQFRGCINPAWNVARIFEYNDLNLTYFSRYEALFGGIEFDRCDYFSRGVGEIRGEYEHFKEQFPSLAYEEHVLLRTRLANFIYVNKDHPELAERLHEGLKRAAKSGAFDKFFNSFYGQDVTEFNLESRQVIFLDSPSTHTGAPPPSSPYWLGN